MKILTRYILREFCIPLFYCFMGFTSIYLLFELFGSFSRLMAAKPDFLVAADYLMGYLAPYFQWMAPACLMLATLYTMWRFCRHSEIVAMRASGIGFFTIVKPILAMAALIACAVWWVNESYVPSHSSWAKKFRDAKFDFNAMASANRLLYVNEKTGCIWHASMSQSPDETVLENVTVETSGMGSNQRRRIVSPRAIYKGDTWYFFAPRVTKIVTLPDGSHVETLDPEVPEDGGLRSFPELDDRPEDITREKCEWAFRSTRNRIASLEAQTNLGEQDRRSRRYDVWAKAVAPLACFVITLFAIPMGIATGRQSVFKGIVGALAMFFAFYGLTILCMVLAGRGWLAPFPAAILPNLVFIVLGARLFWRNR